MAEIKEIDLGPVKGSKGDKGDPGERGPEGPAGPQGKDGVVNADTAITFQQASNRQNIASGEKIGIILGKIQKFFQDLKPHAFAAVVDNLESEDENLALSARQGMELKKMIDNRKMTKLWSGSVGNDEGIYLNESIEKFNSITLVYQKNNSVYYNCTFLTSVLLKTNVTNFAQQTLGKDADASIYMDSHDRTHIQPWMSSNLKLIEVYGH